MRDCGKRGLNSGFDDSALSVNITLMKALIVVDLNRDFFPGGALAVTDADTILPVVNSLIADDQYGVVAATQDWHPAGHCSFEQWPDHCVAGTPGAELHPEVDREKVDVLIRKGFESHCDSYSGFYDALGRSNGLEEILKARRVAAVDIVGLATDYCVKATAIDAVRQAGFRTRVLLPGCRGVDLEPGDIGRALNTMDKAGVELVEG